MQVNIPYLNGADFDVISVTPILDFSVTVPYITPTMESYEMSIKEIILRLEAAIEDKDWEAVELLLEDLRLDNDDFNREYDQFSGEDEY
jgi:hypothetical protein